MAAAVSLAVSLPSSKSTLISTRTSLVSQDRLSFTKVSSVISPPLQLYSFHLQGFASFLIL
ncbi:putative ferredoxin--NADP(+) reductase [Helianthus annuus]|nr:putative ferredoxin--NADP(+) reductase [Helianthus annuus]